MSAETQMRRLNAARTKVQEVTQRRMRLEGELEVHTKSLTELEAKSRTQFGCEVDELPDLIEKLEKEGESAVAQAEKLLGVV